MKPRVLLDCDGILSAFIPGALRIVNAMLGTSHVSADVTEFDFCAALGLAPDIAASVKRAIGATHGFCAALEVLPGAIDGVRLLREVADVYVVTSPWNSNPTWMSEREAWLARHFGIAHAKVIHTSAKYVCAGDFLVDDKTSTLVSWRKAHPTGIAVRWATDHNWRDDWNGESTCSWRELIALVVRRAETTTGAAP